MIRRITYLLLTALLLFGCRKADDTWTEPYIEICLLTADPIETKSSVYEQGGTDYPYNENLMTTVDFFFYPGGDTSVNATWHERRTSNKTRTDLMHLRFTSEEINTYIFPSSKDISECKVFVLVNYPEEPDNPLVPKDGDGKDILTKTDLNSLLSKEVVTDFVRKGKSNHYQPDFLMSGETTLTLRGRNQILSASGTVILERYACKMTVGVKVAPQVLVGNNVWEPMLESMELYLVDGVTNVSLGGRTESPTYLNYKEHAMRFVDDGGNPVVGMTGDYYDTDPFYMYPQKWTYGSTKYPTKEPYLKLVLPWKRVVGGYTQKPFYYKIVLPNDHRPEYICQFVRNNWYNVNIDVSILGAETDDAEVSVPGSVYVVYWQDKNVVIKNAEIGRARYLSVNEPEYYLYNVSTEVELPYVSSHPVIVKDIVTTRPYYGTVSPGSDDKGGTVCLSEDGKSKYLSFNKEQRKNLNGEKEWYTDSGTSIVFQHTLNNNYKSDSFDYSPYTFTFTLEHADKQGDPVYTKQQKVVQYPAIYIKQFPDPDVMKNGHPEHWGYVYINNGQYTKLDADQDPKHTTQEWKDANVWRVIYYSSGGREMVQINATVLGDSEFIIGDPRQKTIDNLREFETAPALEGGNRTLTWYYPTENSERTADMIAPSYLISTKYSGTEYGGTGLEQARWRCAAFQENGYPAGRWRLPTRGEIRFAAQLSAKGIFEWQFDSNYWSANGAVNVDKKTGVVKDSDVTTALIRCVYDSWYWDEKDQIADKSFKWGDRLR